MKRLSFTFLSMLLSTSLVLAQTNIYDNCRSVITDGLRQYSIKTDSNENLNVIFDNYCDASGSAKTQTASAGLDTIVDEIPTRFTGSYTNKEEAVRNFCRNYSSVAAARSNSTDYKETIVLRAYESFDQCIALAATGVIVRHSIRSLSDLDFFLAPGFSHPIAVRGVNIATTKGSVTCKALVPGSQNGDALTLSLNTRFSLTNNDTLNISCLRTPVQKPDGKLVYGEANVTIFTNITPNGNYNAFFPSDESLPEDRASNIETSIAKLNDNIGNFRDFVKYNITKPFDDVKTRLGPLNVQKLSGNNGIFSCDNFCVGNAPPVTKNVGTCVAARKEVDKAWVSCATAIGNDGHGLACWCNTPID